MKIFAEKEAERFLKKEGFKILDEIFIKKESELKKALTKFNFPVVLKVSGKKIIHKKKVGGVKMGINNYTRALNAFNQIKKINGFEEAVIEEQVKGQEFLFGIKKTSEFGHVIVFGAGGSDVEKIKNVSFRVCPIDYDEAEEMVKEIKFEKGLDSKIMESMPSEIIKLCRLSKKYHNIQELDINPMIIENNVPKIVDARIVFE